MSETPPAWPLITLERVYELNVIAVAHAGGTAGPREPGVIEGAVEGAKMSAFYKAEGEDPDPLWVAAYLLFNLSTTQGFVDGNKRVAWLAMEEQLRMVGARVVASQEEAEAFVLGVAERRATNAEQVFDWIIAHLAGDYG